MSFFDNLPHDQAAEIEQLSRLIYELREHRKDVLGLTGAADETALLERIGQAAVPEHPAYEHYLAARILADLHDTARAVLAERLLERGR
jgi:hypothetical protein